MLKCLVLIAVFCVLCYPPETEGSWHYPRVYTITSCEHKWVHLRCRGNRRIYVVHTMYGRTNTRTCSRSGNFRNTRCKARHATWIVKRKCNGRLSCNIRASNHVFGDPCRGTFKYLTVRYQCKRGSRHYG